MSSHRSDRRDLAESWPEREKRWRHKLGRIRLGVEPIPEQVERYRRVTVMISAVASGIGSLFVALFAAFRKPIYGLIVAGILIGPIIVSSWLGFFRLRTRAEQYLKEREEAERCRADGSP